MKDRRQWAEKQTAVATSVLDAKPRVWSEVQQSRPLGIADAVKWGVGSVTLICENAPFSQVMSDIAPQLGVSVVAGDVPAKVTCAFTDSPGEEVVRAICLQANVVPEFSNGVLRFRKPGDGAESWSMFFPAYDDSRDIAEAIKAVLPKDAEVREVGGRLLVAADRESVLKAQEVVRHAHAAGPDGWMLEVSLVGVSRSLRKELGIAWGLTGGGKLGIDAAAGNILAANTPVFGARAFAALEMIGRALEDGQEAVTLTSGTLLLLEGGQETRFQQGDVVPVPQRTVSPEGTVTTTGFTTVETGFQFAAKGRRVPDGLHVEIEPKLSGVTGYVEGYPIVSQRTVKGAAVLRSGEWMLLSGLDGMEWSRDGSTIPGLPALRVFGREAESITGRSLIVLVRAERIYGSGQSAVTP